MDEEPDVQAQKPTSLLLKHSNNKMLDKITVKKGMGTAGEKVNMEPKTEIIVVDETATTSKSSKTGIDQETCAMFAQIIDNDDATWELLSDAASWEASFPKEILTETDSLGTTLSLENESDELPPGWKKVSDSGGSYFWNTETGKTQRSPPSFVDNVSETTMSTSGSNNLVDGTAQTSEREGHMFLVRSLGWLPMESENLKPDISSAAVNSCIRLLSNNRSQIMDGIGVWGEGKDLMLMLNDSQLKVVDPVENTILQTQSIKHIRLWGVGRDSSYDFAYVVRDPTTKVYKCHVFRCEAPAQAIAKQLHAICSSLVLQKRLTKQAPGESTSTDLIPTASSEPRQIFEAQFVGLTQVSSPTGITVLKEAIKKLTEDCAMQRPVTASVSASALVVNDKDSLCIVNCRMRCLSFMGVGDDIKLFGFISVIAGQATCYVLRCEPNAAKLALAVQEACMLRYQKAIDSNQTVEAPPETTTENRKSLKKKVLKLFSGMRRSGS